MGSDNAIHWHSKNPPQDCFILEGSGLGLRKAQDMLELSLKVIFYPNHPDDFCSALCAFLYFNNRTGFPERSSGAVDSPNSCATFISPFGQALAHEGVLGLRNLATSHSRCSLSPAPYIGPNSLRGISEDIRHIGNKWERSFLSPNRCLPSSPALLMCVQSYQ